MLTPKKVASICIVHGGGGGGSCSGRVTVKSLFHSLAIGHTISFACLTCQCNFQDTAVQFKTLHR